MANIDLQIREKRWCLAPYEKDLKLFERAFLLSKEWFERYGDEVPDLVEVPSKASPLLLIESEDNRFQLIQKLVSHNYYFDELAWLYCDLKEYQRGNLQASERYEYQEAFAHFKLTSADVSKMVQESIAEQSDSLGALAIAFNNEISKYGAYLNTYQIHKITGVPRSRYQEILKLKAVPSKGTIYSLAFFFKFDLEKTREWLRLAGYTSFNTIPDRLFEESFNNEERGFASFCMACTNTQATIRALNPTLPKKLTALDGVIASRASSYTDGCIVDFLESIHKDPREYGFKPNKHLAIPKL